MTTHLIQSQIQERMFIMYWLKQMTALKALQFGLCFLFALVCIFFVSVFWNRIHTAERMKQDALNRRNLVILHAATWQSHRFLETHNCEELTVKNIIEWLQDQFSTDKVLALEEPAVQNSLRDWKDSYGNPIQFIVKGKTVRICSAGSDGVFDSNDDLSNPLCILGRM